MACAAAKTFFAAFSLLGSGAPLTDEKGNAVLPNPDHSWGAMLKAGQIAEAHLPALFHLRGGGFDKVSGGLAHSTKTGQSDVPSQGGLQPNTTSSCDGVPCSAVIGYQFTSGMGNAVLPNPPGLAMGLGMQSTANFGNDSHSALTPTTPQ